MSFIILEEPFHLLCPFFFFGGRTVELERGEICSLGSPRPGARCAYVL